jgi:hypothetical protein
MTPRAYRVSARFALGHSALSIWLTGKSSLTKVPKNVHIPEVSSMIRIAILFHENETDRETPRYVIHHLAEFWRERGDEVTFVYGTKDFVPADVAIVHVNLSLVPKPYLDLAARYPVVLNGRLSDIRKTRVSKNLVKPGDGWRGKVIIKSNNNFFGAPERLLQQNSLERRFDLARRFRDVMDRIRFRGMPIQEARDYAIFDSVDQIPEKWFSFKDAVIERFLPEMENGLYHLRMVQVLGDSRICTRLSSNEPIIKARNSLSSEIIDPDPMVDQWCRDFNLDYGKLDYLIWEGTPILLDVNKTVGATRGYRATEELSAARRYLADGIYGFLNQ